MQSYFGFWYIIDTSLFYSLRNCIAVCFRLLYLKKHLLHYYTELKKNTFPANKQRRQLAMEQYCDCESLYIMNVYIARNNMQFNSYDSVKKYRLYSGFFLKSSNSMQYRSMLFNCIRALRRDRFKAIWSRERIVGSFEHK